MYLERIPLKRKKTRRQTVNFGGLDRTESARAGALTDSTGLSAAACPGLTQRQGRKAVRRVENAGGLYAFGKLVTVEGTDLCYDGQIVGTVAPGEKQFAVVGGKLCVFPDKKYLDLTSREFADLGARSEGVENSAVFTETTLELNESLAALSRYNEYAVTPPPSVMRFRVVREEDLVWDPVTGWGDMPFVEVMGNRLQYLEPGWCFMYARSTVRGDRFPDYEGDGRSFATEYDQWGDYFYLTGPVTWEDHGNWRWSWMQLPAERRSMSRRNPQFADRGFRPGDTVTVSGCVTYPENNRDVRIAQVEGTTLLFDEPVFTAGQEAGVVLVERRIPDLDYVCESGGRLVGVSSADRTVYLSALGDPRNFYDDRGLAQSSARLPVGSAGDFTGCVAYSGRVLLFKEDCLHRLMGARPGSYVLYTDHVAGLQAGSGRSMAIINEVLYYKSRDGVYAYTGSTPKLVSRALGNALYDRAAGGSDGRRYYISMRRLDTDTWELLTYDTRTGIWLKEDQLEADAFVRTEDGLYMLSDNVLYALNAGEDDQGRPIAWEAVFAPFHEGAVERKYPSRLLVRLELEPGAWVEAQLARDGGGFQTVWTSHGDGPTALIPLRPGRCDSYQLKLKGEGRCVLRGLTREFSLGGVR